MRFFQERLEINGGRASEVPDLGAYETAFAGPRRLPLYPRRYASVHNE